MSTCSTKMLLIFKLLFLFQGVSAGLIKCPFPFMFSDIVNCKMAGCEYSIKNGSCRPLYKDCPNKIGITGCRRANTIYSQEGVACHNKWELGNCTVGEVVLAVNLGSDEDFEDNSGINYVNNNAEVYTDEESTHKNIESHLCRDGVTGIDEEDGSLWSTQIMGSSSSKKRKSGNCITYQAKLPKDGVYELNIKTVETVIRGRAVTRLFNIRINDVVVVPEINIRNYVKLCKALELIIEFELDEGGLTPVGLPEIEIPSDGAVDIGFCYGDGKASDNYNPDYLVSAFYIAEMAGKPDDDEETDKPSTRPNVNTSPMETIQITTSAITQPTMAPSDTTTEWPDEEGFNDQANSSSTVADMNTSPPPPLPEILVSIIPSTTTFEPSSPPPPMTSVFPEGSSSFSVASNVTIMSSRATPRPPVKRPPAKRPPVNPKTSGKDNNKNIRHRKKKPGSPIGDGVIAVKKYVGKLGIF